MPAQWSCAGCLPAQQLNCKLSLDTAVRMVGSKRYKPLTHTWLGPNRLGQDAEKVLSRSARSEAILGYFSMDVSQASSSSSCSSTSKRHTQSLPRLRPLALPGSPLGSTFAALASSRTEPIEFVPLRIQEVRRQAWKLVRALQKVVRARYKDSLSKLGKSLRSKPTWPFKEEERPQVSFERPPLRAVYGVQSVVVPSSSSASCASWGVSQILSEEDFEDQSVKVERGAGREQRAAWRRLKQLGRSSHGAPCTLHQVYAEVEACVQHRQCRDTRAQLGCLGPVDIGLGATRARRPLTFTNATGEP